MIDHDAIELLRQCYDNNIQLLIIYHLLVIMGFLKDAFQMHDK